MNDFKTSGCKPSYTGDSPYAGYIVSNGAMCSSVAFAKPLSLNLNCSDVTFRLKELDINLNTNSLETYFSAIDTLIINGMKFVKVGPEKS